MGSKSSLFLYNKDMLICPICQEPLNQEEKGWSCPNRHHFDRAKQGYVNLSRKQKTGQGDNKEMIQARTSFLESGMYDFLLKQLKEIVGPYAGTYVDMGCGQGFYTRELAGSFEQAFGIDASKSGVAFAAKHDSHTQYIVGNLFHIPLSDQSVDVLTSIFVPLADQEALRLLKKEGIWVVVQPGPMHCWELKEVLYETPIVNPRKVKEFAGLTQINEIHLTKKKKVHDIQSLLAMTPYQYHSTLQAQEQLFQHPSLYVTFDFVISVYQKQEELV